MVHVLFPEETRNRLNESKNLVLRHYGFETEFNFYATALEEISFKVQCFIPAKIFQDFVYNFLRSCEIISFLQR